MSARSRPRLVVSVRAKRDIDDILLYTRQRWGVEQRRRYRSHLRQAMDSLLTYPELGQPRDDHFAGCRSLGVERHIIFYHRAGDEIIVDRVLHGSQDATGKVRP